MKWMKHLLVPMILRWYIYIYVIVLGRVVDRFQLAVLIPYISRHATCEIGKSFVLQVEVYYFNTHFDYSEIVKCFSLPVKIIFTISGGSLIWITSLPPKNAPLHPGSDAVLPCQARVQREGRGGTCGKRKCWMGKCGKWKNIPSWELTYPLPRQFWRWFSFSEGGIC